MAPSASLVASITLNRSCPESSTAPPMESDGTAPVSHPSRMSGWGRRFSTIVTPALSRTTKSRSVCAERSELPVTTTAANGIEKARILTQAPGKFENGEVDMALDPAPRGRDPLRVGQGQRGTVTRPLVLVSESLQVGVSNSAGTATVALLSYFFNPAE